MELDVKEMRGFRVGDSFKTPNGKKNWVSYYDADSEKYYTQITSFEVSRKIIGFKQIEGKDCIVISRGIGYNWAIPFSELERIGMIPKESMEFNIWN